MKKTVRIINLLVAALLLAGALSACDRGVTPAPETDTSLSASFTPHKFGPEDAVVNGMQMGVTTLEQAKEILGEPEDIFTDEWHAWYEGTFIGTIYDDGSHLPSLEFYDINKDGNDRLTSVCSDESPAFTFVNELHVGSTKDEVLATFTYEDNPAPLYFAHLVTWDANGERIYGEPAGEYIYGDTNSTWFAETKPTGALQYAYMEPRDALFGNSYTMTYDYCEPLNWNDDGSDDRSDFTGVCYRLVFFLDGETDTVTDINLYYLVISEFLN